MNFLENVPTLSIGSELSENKGNSNVKITRFVLRLVLFSDNPDLIFGS
jgi:hypothetical protein